MTDAQFKRLLNNVYNPKFKTKNRTKLPPLNIDNVIYVDFTTKTLLKKDN